MSVACAAAAGSGAAAAGSCGACVECGPLFHRWLQGSGPLTPEFADRAVEVALDGLRR